MRLREAENEELIKKQRERLVEGEEEQRRSREKVHNLSAREGGGGAKVLT